MTKNNNNKNTNKNNKSNKNNDPKKPIIPNKKIILVISRKTDGLDVDNDKNDDKKENKNDDKKENKNEDKNEDKNKKENDKINDKDKIDDKDIEDKNKYDDDDFINDYYKDLEKENEYYDGLINDYYNDIEKDNEYDDDDDDYNYDDDDDDDYDDDDDDDDEYNEDDYKKDNDFNEQLEKEHENNSRKRKPINISLDKDPYEKEPFSNIFHIMSILGRPLQNDGPPDAPDDAKEPLKKKSKKSVDNFLEYFKNAKDLKPIDMEVKNLDDLIKLGETYDPKDTNKYVINMQALNKCVPSLKELNNMIGMKNVKEMIVDLIFFRLQNFGDEKEELWHLVIQGSPGCGKTEVSKIIGKLYYSLGIVKKDKFIQVKRSDLIGKYLGHTAKQTQQIFDDNEGGVIFIDEAYSLGNPEGKDSFSKECIDTINLNLTEKKNTAVFIAGYKEQLDESFFNYNPGLNRRFKMRLNVDKYDAPELRQIYLKKLKENNWGIFEDENDKNIPLKFFEKNLTAFKYNGGDMENLWHLTKIVHARRVFGKSNDLVKKISLKDLENAFKSYSENDEFKKRNEDVELKKYIQNTIYC